MITKTIQATIGATNLERDLLNFLADTLTNNNPAWSSEQGDGSGAWAVSQRWYGVVTPRTNVLAQAGQGLRVLREKTLALGDADEWPGLACYYTAVLRLWWEPGLIALVNEYRDIHGKYPTSDELGWDSTAAKSWIGITKSVVLAVKENWILVLVCLVGIGFAIWLLTKGKK